MQRRDVFKLMTVLFTGIIMGDQLLVRGSGMAEAADPEGVTIWLGTSGSRASRGIYRSSLNTNSGRLADSKLVAEINGPGFLAKHPSLEVLYAVGTPLGGAPSVVAYKISGPKRNPELQLMGSQEVGDGGACHVSIDPTGQTLLTAQYGGGSVAAYQLAKDGSITKQTALINHEGGSGVVPNRQDSSHAHWTGFSPDNRFAFVPDLGLDKVVIYAVDLESSKLTPHGYGKVPAGGGPRHMKFHHNGKWIFVLNELSLSITVFDWDADSGKMTPKQTIPTVSKQALAKEPFNSASEIRVHPSGQFVYSANRGHDTISAFRVNQKSGELTLIEIENVRAATPRNFNVSPDGNWLVAGGQDSHTLGAFAIDKGTGELTYARSIISTPSPICVLFDQQ